MSPSSSTESAWASGVALFAGIWMFIIGAFQFLQGLVAVLNDQFYVAGRNYTYKFDLTAWGWIHMILGALLVLVAIFVINGATWARISGIVLAGLSALANFMWLPYYPLWAILIIAGNALVIWGLATAPARYADL